MAKNYNISATLEVINKFTKPVQQFKEQIRSVSKPVNQAKESIKGIERTTQQSVNNASNSLNILFIFSPNLTIWSLDLKASFALTPNLATISAIS